MQSGGGGGEERRRAVAQHLEAALGELLDGELRRLSSGASRETFLFSTRARGALVVQIARGADKVVSAPPEAALLRAAAAAGVPVPAVIAEGPGGGPMGSGWTVLEALAGTSDPKAILAAEGVPDGGPLIDQLAAALAAIHRIPLGGGAIPGLPEVDDPLSGLREWHERLGEPHPAFELAFVALSAGRPPQRARTVVHGDFRMGNLMVAEQGLTGVLDWELSHAGDPVEDLGWLCVPAWRFGRPDRAAAGLATRAELLDAYERHSGVRVDPAALAWWELAGTVRWGVICVMQAFSHLSGARRSVEHAVIGRRACEVEWDLLGMLGALPADAVADAPRSPGDDAGEGSTGPAPAAPATPAAPAAPAAPAVALHDRPTAVELLHAARGALGDDVLPHLDGRPAFQLRVVLRALGIVTRELEHQADHTAIHAVALASVGCHDERELALAIREGRLDARDPQVLAAVRDTVRAKLEVANPGYLNHTNPATEER
ncbi:MAG TPA: phosphotransferase family protein [Solirubrobacteraceae bacterium]|nr:phosphotransferase family protein [Solirubrobacteraceae bacterium]